MNNKDRKYFMYSIAAAICIMTVVILFSLNYTNNSMTIEEPIETNENTVSGNAIKDKTNYNFVYYLSKIPISKKYSVTSINTEDDCITYNLESGDILKYENNSWILLHDDTPVFQYTGLAYMEYIGK